MDVKAPDEGQYRFGPFLLDPAERLLKRDGAPVEITYRVFEMLLALVRSPGRLLTKDELLEAVWPGRFMEESSLKQAIFTLRKALNGDNDNTQYIATASGRGYSFTVPVERIVAPPAIAAGEIGAFTDPIPQSTIAHRRASWTSKRPRAALIALGAVLALLLAGMATIYWRSLAPAPATRARVVVLADFQNLTNDSALGLVLGKVLQVDLAQSPYLNLLTQQQINETLQQMERPNDTPLTAALAQEVCSRNGGDAVFTGAVARAGNRFFVTLEAKDCRHGSDIVATKSSADREEELPGALDDLTLKMRKGLQESGDSIRTFDVPIVQATTSSFEALKAYSLGEQLRIHGDNAGALPFYKHAIELDPSFALAYAELANCYRGLRELETARTFTVKAFALKDRTTENEKLGITANYFAWSGNYVEAERAFTIWAQTYPDFWAPRANLANLQTNMARYNDAIASARRAVELNPHHYATYVVLARAYKRATRFAEAKAIATLAARKGFDSWDMHGILYEIAYAEGDAAAMAAQVAKEKGKPTETWMLDYEALGAMTSGQLKRAHALWEQSIALTRSQGPDSAEEVGDFYSDEIETTDVLASSQEAKKVADTASAAEKLQFEDFAFASIGDYKRAVDSAEAAAKAHPDSTDDHDIELPLTLAKVDLAQEKAAAAIAALQPVLPYELRDFWAAYLLGGACLGTGAGEKAELEFRKILANRGVDGLSPLYPVAYLGLARALHMEGRIAESRAAYERLFAFWKDADSDLPALVQARAEYAKL